MRIAALRVLGGSFFVLAGLSAYYGIGFGLAAPVILVLGGVAVLLVTIAGHRATGGDIAIFVIGLLVLAGVTTGLAFTSSTGMQITFLAARSRIGAHTLDLLATTTAGGIQVFFTNASDLAYRVVFKEVLGVPFVSGGHFGYSLTNSTSRGAFLLNATSSLSDIVITLGTGFLVNMNLSSGAGSIHVDPTTGDQFGGVYLHTGAGSVDAAIDSREITAIAIGAGAGSVNFRSDGLGTTGARIPFSVSTGAGTVSTNITFAWGMGVSLGASAGLGSLSHSLQGFTVTQDSANSLVAEAGSMNGPSFMMNVSTGLGSANVRAVSVGNQ